MGRLIREGLQVAIVGPPNVGKSSLFNALAGARARHRHRRAGTTRDLVTEMTDIEGLRVTLVDTAGLRDTDDVVEAEGVARARSAASGRCDPGRARLGSSAPRANGQWTSLSRQRDDSRREQVGSSGAPGHGRAAPSGVSAATGAGLDELRGAIVAALERRRDRRDRPAMTNVRHVALLERRARRAARCARRPLQHGGTLPEEFVLADLQEARAALEEITGTRRATICSPHIFARFCIGK